MRVLRVQEVAATLGISRYTVWRWERAGRLPPRRRIGPNTIGWLETEIDEFLKSRPVVRTPPPPFSPEQLRHRRRRR